MLIDASSNLPVAHKADRVTSEDLRRFKATLGDSACVPEFELLALLVSLHARQDEPCGTRAGLWIQGDSTAALGVALQLASPRPLTNVLAAEVSLQLERLGADVRQVSRYRLAPKVETDALSRSPEGAPLPWALRHVSQAPAGGRRAEFYHAWPADW